LFDRESLGSSGQRWSFFDHILLRYLDGASEEDKKEGDSDKEAFTDRLTWYVDSVA
jgi:hypothetical protein